MVRALDPSSDISSTHCGSLGDLGLIHFSSLSIKWNNNEKCIEMENNSMYHDNTCKHLDVLKSRLEEQHFK